MRHQAITCAIALVLVLGACSSGDGATATVPSGSTDASDIERSGDHPCGDSPTSEVRTWSSDTTEVSLLLRDNGAYLVSATDESGTTRQHCLGGESAKAGLEHGTSLAWAMPADDGVLIAIMHPVGRQIIAIDELTELGPVAPVGSSDYDLSVYVASPDGAMPSGNPSLDNLARAIRHAVEGTVLPAPLTADILVPETDDDAATSETSPPGSVLIPHTTPIGTPQNLAEVEALIAVVEFDGDEVDVAAPYFGSQDPAGGPANPREDFVPTAQDRPFCWAVAVINARPQPRDEYQEIVVADQYFAALQPFAVAQVADELDALIDFTHTIVAHGSFTDGDEVDPGDPVADARHTVNTFVDQHCLGLA